MVLLSANGGFSKYSNYLIGDILAVSPDELLLLLFVLLGAVSFWVFAFNPLMVSSLNPDLASSKGISVKLYQNLFMIVVAFIVTVSIKWVGILIINALLVLPAAAARNISGGMRSYHGLVDSIFFVFRRFRLILSYYLGTSAGAPSAWWRRCCFCHVSWKPGQGQGLALQNTACPRKVPERNFRSGTFLMGNDRKAILALRLREVYVDVAVGVIDLQGFSPPVVFIRLLSPLEVFAWIE